MSTNHDDVPDRYIVSAFEVMAGANWHAFQILTKRPERMRKMLKNDLEFAGALSHIWWGVTVENRKHGLPRLNCLQQCDVQMRFLSCEPLLEDLGTPSLDGINRVIVGGLSGPGARRCRRSGSYLCRVSASLRAFRSISSNGVDSQKASSDVSSMDGSTPFRR